MLSILFELPKSRTSYLWYGFNIINNNEIEIIVTEDGGGDDYEIDDISELVTRLHPNQPKGYGLEIRIG